MDIAFLQETLFQVLSGLPLTLNLATVSVLAGGVLALLLALICTYGAVPLARVARSYIFVFRGTPLLVQLFLIYYGLGQFRPQLQAIGLWGLLREPYWCAVLALTLNTAAYGGEILRGGLQSVPSGVIEAARASGLSGWLTLRFVTLPIAFRHALPAYGNEIILMIKSTSLASVVTLMEVTGIAGKIIAESYRAVEVFVVAGAIYLTINFLLTRAVQLLEWRLSAHLRPSGLDRNASAAKAQH